MRLGASRQRRGPDFDRAIANERNIVAAVERFEEGNPRHDSDAVRLRELQREVDASRQVYQAFLQRALETGEQEGIDSSNIRVITEAVSPRSKNRAPARKLCRCCGLLVAAWWCRPCLPDGACRRDPPLSAGTAARGLCKRPGDLADARTRAAGEPFLCAGAARAECGTAKPQGRASHADADA